MGQSDNVKMNIRRRYGIRKDHCYYVTTSMIWGFGGRVEWAVDACVIYMI